MDNVFISVTKEERHKVLVSDWGSCVVSVASWQWDDPSSHEILSLFVTKTLLPFTRGDK